MRRRRADAAEAVAAGTTSAAGGHCGGSRGGRTLRRQSWRGQLAHAVAAKAGAAALREEGRETTFRAANIHSI